MQTLTEIQNAEETKIVTAAAYERLLGVRDRATFTLTRQKTAVVFHKEQFGILERLVSAANELDETLVGKGPIQLRAVLLGHLEFALEDQTRKLEEVREGLKKQQAVLAKSLNDIKAMEAAEQPVYRVTAAPAV